MASSAQYSKREELLNAATHAVGTLLAVVGTIALIMAATRTGSGIAVASSAIFGLTMVAMYTMSTLYHAIRPGRAKDILRVFDHSSIYLLIAGAYAPITLVLLGGMGKALLMFVAVFVAAIVGIILSIIDMVRFKRINMLLYLIMGWGALADIVNIANRLGTVGTALLIGGGIAYTVGVIFYKMKQTRYMHGVWHVFVVLGSVLHYLCIYRYVILPMH